jgi:hypothetical protein
MPEYDGVRRIGNNARRYDPYVLTYGRQTCSPTAQMLARSVPRNPPTPGKTAAGGSAK